MFFWLFCRLFGRILFYFSILMERYRRLEDDGWWELSEQVSLSGIEKITGLRFVK